MSTKDDTGEGYETALYIEPVTFEQALANAVHWATKAGTLAIEQWGEVMASSIDAACRGLRRALANVQREKSPEDIGDMALRYAGQAVVPDRGAAIRGVVPGGRFAHGRRAKVKP